MKKQRVVLLLAFVCLVASVEADATPTFSGLYIFGDSLSDSGNNAIVLSPNVTPVPISGNSFIPTFPYASGHYTNNEIWAQPFASALGLSAAAFLAGGADFAFGGARTGPLNPGGLLDPSGFPPSLRTQAATFLAVTGGIAPASALYVVAGGGNNARDALEAILGGADVVTTIQSAAATYAADIGLIVDDLQGAGAKDIVVWNIPDIGKTPAILADGADASLLATQLASSMNGALLGEIGAEPDVRLFNIFGLIDNVIVDPGHYGLTNASDACARFANCDPSQFLFWDGIHPTSAGHLIISNAMLDTVPEPSALLLVSLGLVALWVFARRARSGWWLGKEKKQD